MNTKLIRRLQHFIPPSQGTVLTIGNFDGIHLGHQALLAEVKNQAQIRNLRSMVMLFEPHPAEFFNRERVPRLMRWREKFKLLSEWGIDYVLLLNFNQSLASLNPEEFISTFLVNHLNTKEIILGEDFRFGHKRQGDLPLLIARGKQYGFQVRPIPSVIAEGERISSTRIRAALGQADLSSAAKWLDRPYTMTGRIVHGNKLGRILGFPTANIFLHRKAVPLQGIFIVRAHGLADHALPGVANIGTRPTIGGTRTLLEVHLFDFARRVYGQHVEIEFIAKIRDEEYFPNLALLKQKMQEDAEHAKDYFKKSGEL